jgi:hypothetical protein
VKAYNALSLAALCLTAACGGSPRLETRSFTLRYLGYGEAEQMLRPYVDTERPGAKGAITVAGGAVNVRETADNLDRIARVLAQYDRPQPSVQLHFKLIRADGEARPDSSIRDVETVLKSLFRFRGYALVAEGMVTGSAESMSEQSLAGSGGPYLLRAGIGRVAGSGDSATVQISVHLDFHGPGGSFSTRVGIPIGKTAVLGNVTGSTSSTALILAVRPDLVAN